MKTYDQQLPISVINELRGVYKKVHGVALLEYLEEVYRKHKLKEGKKVHTNTDQEVCPTVVCSLGVEVKDI